MQALLEAATRKDGGCPPVAPAWSGHGSAGVGHERQVVRDTSKGGNSSWEGQECSLEPSLPEAQQQQRQSPAASSSLTDFSAGLQELDRARLLDLQADRSHVQELRALVTDYKLKGCSGSQEGYMAELLVQVRLSRPVLAIEVDFWFRFRPSVQEFGLIILRKMLVWRWSGLLKSILSPYKL